MDVHKREEVFSQVPDNIPGIKEMLEKKQGWVGFNTPYSQVLRPLFLGDEDKKEMDLVVVDFGCGWGEHVVLAGIGCPNGGIPKVQQAIGLSADSSDVERAKVIAKFAQITPDEFIRIVQNADIEISTGLASPTVQSFQKIILDPILFSELRVILEGSVQDNADYDLRPFLHKHLYGRPVKTSVLNSFSKSQVGGNIQIRNTNIFDPDLSDNFADRIISSSVSSYIRNPSDEVTMWTSILRVIKPGGIINAISYEYQRYGEWTSAPLQLAAVAESLGVHLEEVQRRDAIETYNHQTLRQTIFRVASKH